MLVNTIDKAENKKIIILPEYSGHYENSKFTTRKQEASYIAEYLESNNIKIVDMIYGQLMGG